MKIKQWKQFTAIHCGVRISALSMSRSVQRYQDDDHCLRVSRRLVAAAEYLLPDGATDC